MTIDREFTDLEEQLIDECQKLIDAIRNETGLGDKSRANAVTAAAEVEDFIGGLD